MLEVELSRYFRKKKMDKMKEQINDLEQNSNNKTMSLTYRRK
jgi:hypothetical protein